MIIYVDIDGTICETEGSDYINAKPRSEQIYKINKLYDKGWEVTYWTARGGFTGLDYYNLTKSQLDEWDAKYHDLQVGNKPPYDLLICDKTKRIEEI